MLMKTRKPLYEKKHDLYNEIYGVYDMQFY